MAPDTIHLSLEEDGFPGQWIDVADPGHKSPKQFKVIVALAQGQEEGASGKLLAALIKSWHVLNPETGEALPPPAEADMEDVPLAIAKRFTDCVNERITHLGSSFRSGGSNP